MFNSKNFKLIKKEKSIDLNGECFYFIHKKTHAKVTIILNEDDNKVFTICFRTPPIDNTGIPHILEHSVLCGSKNYPIKDPFVELSKSSLNTFLNAMTYPDKTVYPVASMNDKDFNKLVNVYLDAVFYPNIYIHKEIFEQEGFSYFLKNENSDLTYNGIVYNEMKGVFSSPENILESNISKILYPNSCYKYESGGDPDFIPKLTYEKFLKFHKKYYTPSNSYILFYGHIDINEKLNLIDEYLCNFKYVNVDSNINVKKTKIKQKSILKYSVNDKKDIEDGYYYSYNISFNKNMSIEEVIAIDILNYILFNMDGAIIKQKLLKEGVFKDIYSSYETCFKYKYLSIVAKNSKKGCNKQFITIIKESLKDILKKGINKDYIKSVININEFKIRESNFGRYPKGLIYILRILDFWIYNEKDVFISCNLLTVYKNLKKYINTDFFENIIKKFFLDNKDKANIILSPILNLQQVKEDKLKKELKDIKNSLSKMELKQLIDNTNSLIKYKETPDSKKDIKKIGVLKRKDISKNIKFIDNHIKNFKYGKELNHYINTNDIMYVKIFFPICDISDNQWLNLKILSKIFGSIDTKKYKYLQLSSKIDKYTGGISTNIDTFVDYKNGKKCKAYFVFEIKMLEKNIKKGIDILYEIIVNSQFNDENRIKQIICEFYSDLKGYIYRFGNVVALNRSNAHFDIKSYFEEKTNGIEAYKKIKKIHNNLNDFNINDIIKLKDKIITANNNILVISGNKKLQKNVKKRVCEIFKNLKIVQKKNIFLKGSLIKNKKEAFIIPSTVYYVARSGIYKNQKYNGAFLVLKTIMDYNYLWENIRVLGGAYGQTSLFLLNNICGFSSFRDPHLKNTNDVYIKIPNYIKNINFDKNTLDKYVIGTISKLDIPMTTQMKIDEDVRMYISNIDKKQLIKYRKEVLKITNEDIKKLSTCIEQVMKCDNYCVIGSKSKIKKYKNLFDNIESL